MEPLRGRPRADFDQDPYLRDIVERNLEVAAQCCLDICHRIISLEKFKKPRDYYESILFMAEMGVLSSDFARRLAPIAGFRNILAHEYLAIDWDIVHRQLNQLERMTEFAGCIRSWMRQRGRSEK